LKYYAGGSKTKKIAPEEKSRREKGKEESLQSIIKASFTTKGILKNIPLLF